MLTPTIERQDHERQQQLQIHQLQALPSREAGSSTLSCRRPQGSSHALERLAVEGNCPRPPEPAILEPDEEPPGPAAMATTGRTTARMLARGEHLHAVRLSVPRAVQVGEYQRLCRPGRASRRSPTLTGRILTHRQHSFVNDLSLHHLLVNRPRRTPRLSTSRSGLSTSRGGVTVVLVAQALTLVS